MKIPFWILCELNLREKFFRVNLNLWGNFFGFCVNLNLRENSLNSSKFSINSLKISSWNIFCFKFSGKFTQNLLRKSRKNAIFRKYAHHQANRLDVSRGAGGHLQGLGSANPRAIFRPHRHQR